MKATFLPDVVTALLPRDVLWAMRVAFRDVVGLEPTRETVALLTAQSALETGRWKSIHCFNLGNIKAGESYEGYYTMFRCNEVIGGKVVWFDPPHAQTRFRAFTSLENGARDHLLFLSSRERYASAWQSLIAGDPSAFVRDLKSADYFTADEEPYRAAVSSLFREYLATLTRDMPEPPPVAPERPMPLAGPISVAASVVSDGLRELSQRDTEPE